jgi:hypothetical protein
MPARVLDVSRSGLRLRLEQPLQLGLFVEVRWPSYAIFGEIRHCASTDAGAWDVGIRIQQAVHRDAVPGAHLSLNELSLFLSGSMSKREMRASSDHIESCPMCKAELAAIEDQALGRLLEYTLGPRATKEGEREERVTLRRRGPQRI